MAKNKKVFKTEDFEKLNFHDCPIYSIAFYPEKNEVSFDIDYILEWRKEKHEKYYSFLVAPATVVFKNVYAFNLESGGAGFTIDLLSRKNKDEPVNYEFVKSMEWEWKFECHEGDIVFKSVGFDMYLRKKPFQIKNQKIDINERGGVSFERLSYVD